MSSDIQPGDIVTTFFGDSVRLYPTPDDNGDAFVGRAHRGEICLVLAHVGDWCCVLAPETYGWNHTSMFAIRLRGES